MNEVGIIQEQWQQVESKYCWVLCAGRIKAQARRACTASLFSDFWNSLHLKIQEEERRRQEERAQEEREAQQQRQRQQQLLSPHCFLTDVCLIISHAGRGEA